MVSRHDEVMHSIQLNMLVSFEKSNHKPCLMNGDQSGNVNEMYVNLILKLQIQLLYVRFALNINIDVIKTSKPYCFNIPITT